MIFCEQILVPVTSQLGPEFAEIFEYFEKSRTCVNKPYKMFEERTFGASMAHVKTKQVFFNNLFVYKPSHWVLCVSENMMANQDSISHRPG